MTSSYPHHCTASPATPAYGAAALRTDLARFQFLLGGDERPLFGSGDS